tara:strand:- start:4924 stop:5946 length:1023 start_codon:yes stop_codon:yes gene_type:complete
MKNSLNLIFFIALSFLFSCSTDNSEISSESENTDGVTITSSYTGTASITQGLGTTTTANLYLNGQRLSPVGTITATDDLVFTVPADVNYTDTSFPFASDLYNPDGNKYESAIDALAAFNDSNIIEIDADGEIITGYIFADNYFELYINGEAVGKDGIPFTSFNSNIVKFKVKTPFTIAMLLVDWEENLGLGSEANGGSNYHPGDGGMVAVFHDASQNIIATSSSDWKAQTFYTAPIQDLSCPTENGTTRNTTNCSAADATDGSDFYGLHWQVPDTWMHADFDDSGWPSATTYTNATIGVDNKPSYTNFTDIFDHTTNDAQFIWSTNVVLDNEVIVRYTVK